ncbi:MAG: FAD-binding oxidoreductase [Erythrobacter sp.]|nr:FAD-binding oxidoreductase [Erythrobacter sp.]
MKASRVTEADAIVIGGGIAGLSLAARLATRMKVIVLEAEEAPGCHSSGRSVAFAHFGLGERIVRTLTAASLAEFREMTGPSGAPIANVHPALHIAREDEGETFDALADVHERFGARFERLDQAGIRECAPVLKTGPEAAHSAILDIGSLKLDTDAMLQRHLADLRTNAGSLVTRAPVLSIVQDAGLWSLETPVGAFQAPRLINAAGAWADEIALQAGVAAIGLEPRRRTVIGFAAPEGVDVSRWPFIKTVVDGFYILPEGTSRLLASPMDQTPSVPCDAAPEELDMAIAADRVIKATSLSIRRIEHSWAGLRSFAPDERPVVGESSGAPGFFWFAGQGGYGFQTSAALARIGEAAVLGKEWPEDITAAGIQPGDLSPGRFSV